MKKLNDRKIEQTVDPKLEFLLATRSARWSSKQAAHQASGQARPTNLLVKGKKKCPLGIEQAAPINQATCVLIFIMHPTPYLIWANRKN